jgi:DNA-binding MarR family transcriptional regulator
MSDCRHRLGPPMSDLENQLVQLLRDFTAKVAVAVRQNALESAETALGRVGATRVNGRRPAAAKVQQPRRARATRSTAREPFDAEAAKTQVVSYLLANPGLRMDELAERLKLPTSGLKPLVKKLVDQRMLSAQGNTRGRRYSAAKRATSATARKPEAKPARKRRKKR